MKRGYADIPEGQIHYYMDGTGEPLLLLHQTGSSRSYWKLMPLLSKEYRVFAPDNLGEGNSDPLPPNAEIRDMARSYIHFMDALGLEKVHIFGMHTGNKIGTELGAGWPSRVDGLILCGHTHSIQADHKDQVSVMGARERPLLRRFQPSPDGSHLLKQWATEFNTLTAIWWDTGSLLQEKLTQELLQLRRELVLDVLQARDQVAKYRAIFAFDLAGRMPDIKVKKTLIVEIRVPDESHLNPQGPKLLKIIPNSRLITVQHTGRGKAVEAKADEIAEIILGFLREVKEDRTMAET
jgi:pimeloyl-ACP methyl ester carboxylesterase